MGTFAVVAGDEKFAFGDGKIDFAGGVRFGTVVFGNAPFVVVNKTIRIFVVVDGHDAVFYCDAFAREGNNAFDDVLVGDAVWYGTGERVGDAFGLVFFDGGFVFV